MRKTWQAVAGAALALVVGCSGSSDAVPSPLQGLAGGCSINTDCSSPLVCAFGKCHSGCETSRDCLAGQMCMASDRPFHVCQLPAESTCSYNSDCPQGQLCAVDGKCRDQCQADRDCVQEQVCAQGSCAAPTELDGGRLPPATPDSGAGGSDAGEGGSPTGQPCSYSSDCPVPQICRNALCAYECFGDVDCATGQACVGHRCGAAPVDASVPDGAPDGYAGGCTYSIDCPVPLVCRSGACLFQCMTDPDCAPGEECTGHLCAKAGAPEPQPDGGPDAADASADAPAEALPDAPDGYAAGCTYNSDCASPLVCRNGACVFECVGDTDCPSGNCCVANTCETGAACASDAGVDACYSGLGCTLPSAPCHVGQTDCSTGALSCVDTGASVADGTSCGTDLYCQGGACASCSQGASCVPATNPCHAGTLGCSGSKIGCTDTGTSLANGTSCGTNVVCKAGSCVACTQGASCTPTNQPCHTGTTDCSTGAPVCVDTGSAANGQGCGAGLFCNSGVCGACAAGAPCTPSSNACLVGSTDCSSGLPVCVASTKAVADGTSCGANLVCGAGVCNPCTQGSSCTPSNVCHVGAVDCASGTPVCTETGASVADGTTCGLYKVCGAGQCGSCTAGLACTPINVCHAGKVSCGTGSAVCVDQGSNATDGTPCGSNLYCASGTCQSCTPGTACSPSAACHVGTTTCTTGLPVCADTGVAAPNGTSCGSGLVCNQAACVACPSGAACTLPGTPCHKGVVDCSSGAAVCTDSGSMVANGTVCGTNMVCSAGVCSACTAGGACTPTNNCHTGSFACQTGAQVCYDTGSSVADGTQCSTSSWCKGGVCTACNAGGSCTPTNPCHKGVFSCSGGNVVCTDQGTNVADGTTCPGTSSYCISGSCTGVTASLGLFSGDGQSGSIDLLLPQPVVLRVADTLGNPVAGTTVKLTGPAGTVVLPATSTTGVDGKATFTVRAGRTLGAYTLTASAVGMTSVTVDATATAVATGTIYSAVNVTPVNNWAVPGPATVSPTARMTNIAIASDGTLYLSDPDHAVMYQVDPAGVLSVLAGTGQAGFSGDGGPATSAQLNGPLGIALDEANAKLYFADNGNHRVRIIDLKTRIIATFAGGGSVGAAPWGDGYSAVAASLNYPTHVSLAPDGTVIICDRNHQVFRAVSPTTGIISTWPVSGAGFAGWYTNIGVPGRVLFDAAGTAYFVANVSGCAGGVFRRSPDGSLTLLAGCGSSLSNGALGTASVFGWHSGIAMDPAGNLYFTDEQNQRVRKLDLSGRLWTIAGTGTAGFSGNGGPATSALVNAPLDLAFDAAGTLYFPDYYNTTVRAIAGAASATPAEPILSQVSGDGQTVWPNQLQSLPMVVKLTDAGGTPLVGMPITWSAVEPACSVTATSLTTDLNGQVSLVGRAGLAVGTCHFKATYLDTHGTNVTGSPVTFALTVAAPPAGTVIPVVNLNHTNGWSGIPGLATAAQLARSFSGMVADASGNLYISDNDACRIDKVDPTGLITRVAGNGCGYSGDGGPALNAAMGNTQGLALDQTNQILYVGEATGSWGARVRAIALSANPPTITTFAGNGTQGASPWGNGQSASTAQTPNPYRLALGPDGALYIGDYNINRIRRVDTSGIINDWLVAGAWNNGAELAACNYNTWGACKVVWDAAGNAYIGGGVGGNTPANWTGPGILKRTPAGVLSVYVGASGSAAGASNAEGTIGSLYTGLSSMQDFTIDAQGNLFIADFGNCKIRRVDASTTQVTTIAGAGTCGYGGDWGPATSAVLAAAPAIAVVPGNHLVFFNDQNNSTPAVRMIW